MPKNKKGVIADLIANIYPNTNKEVTANKVRVPFNDIINSVPFNMTVAQLQAEDDSAEPTTVGITDAGKAGVFFYDSTDITTADDAGIGCIVTSTGKRYKRRIDKAINAVWYGKINYYFDSLAEAKGAIQAFTRFVGLEVTALDQSGNLKAYWFAGGIADANLVAKTTDTFPIEFIVGDGGGLTPADGTTDYVDPVLLGSTMLGAWISGRRVRTVVSPATLSIADAYFQFQPLAYPTPKIVMQNGVFTTDSDYAFMFKK